MTRSARVFLQRRAPFYLQRQRRWRLVPDELAHAACDRHLCGVPSLHRREFLRGTLFSAVAIVVDRTQSPALPELRLAIMVPVAPHDYTDGLAFGVEEATHSLSLFQRRMVVQRSTTPDGIAQSTIVISILPQGDGLLRLANMVTVPVLNVACESDDVRGVSCPRNLFHVVPSRAALQRAASGSSQPAAVELWHHALERFGAAQLNERFVRAHHRPMRSRDWAAWMAIKIAVEAWLRSRSNDPASLGAALAAPTTRFDGHKGVPLSFRPPDLELRQPLYVITGDGSPRELPPPPPSDPTPGSCERGSAA
jgi:hypothetical protein